MRQTLIGFVLVATCFAAATSAQAWGLAGHTIIGQAAMARLPAALPAFVRTHAAQSEITYLQAEEDRLKIGEEDEAAWAREWPTDHYVDVGDDGTIGGAVSLLALPATRDDFDQALERSQPPVDPYRVGFLPYAILEGYEQVRSDFALWRQAVADADRLRGSARSAAQAIVAERQQLTIHDIGIFSHFVGDGSQPLHVTVHYNGWGSYPNPQGFTQSRSTHSNFESAFVERFLTTADVLPLVGPVRASALTPLAEIEAYLKATNDQVVPLYQLEKTGGFSLSDARSAAHLQGVQFTAQRLAAGSQMLDSLILTAWQTSSDIKPER